MRGVATVIVLLLSGPALAGCVGSADAPDPADALEDAVDGTAGLVDPDTGEVVEGLAMPRWSLGDAFTFKDSNDRTPTFVVSEETDTDWIIDTDDPDFAFFTAMDEISTLGRQSKAALAGSQGSERIQYFDWPITDGKTWSTTWDGTTKDLVATKTGEGEYTIEASEEDGTLYARYVVDDETPWFRELSFFQPDGSAGYETRMTSFTSNWTGEVLRYTLEDHAMLMPSGTGVDQAVINFQQSPDSTDIFLLMFVSCETGVFRVDVASEDGSQGHDLATACPYEDVYFDVVGSAPDGQWNIEMSAAMPEESAFFVVHVMERTLETIVVSR